MSGNSAVTESGNDRWADSATVLRGFDLVARNDNKARLIEAQLLRAAERLRCWIDADCVSLTELLERKLGWGPKKARERIRVARALETLPALTAALANGLHYSTVRELTRIVTPATEAAWIAKVRGKVLREVEQEVAGRKRGSSPEDPADPDLRPRVLRFEVPQATVGRFREAVQMLERERGERLDDQQVIEACATALLGGGAERVERATFQIATITQCESCMQAWQVNGGARAQLSKAMLERAECDAVRIGSLETDTPSRARQDVSPAVRRLVEQRDGKRCRAPGCRSTKYLEIHHIEFQSRGGSHDPSNLILLCDGHHVMLHDERLVISGAAPDKVVFTWRNSRPAITVPTNDQIQQLATELDGTLAHLDATAPVDHDDPLALVATPHVELPSTIRADAELALVTLGFKKHVVRPAVAAVQTALPSATLETVVVEALRRLHPRTG